MRATRHRSALLSALALGVLLDIMAPAPASALVPARLQVREGGMLAATSEGSHDDPFAAFAPPWHWGPGGLGGPGSGMAAGGGAQGWGPASDLAPNLASNDLRSGGSGPGGSGPGPAPGSRPGLAAFGGTSGLSTDSGADGGTPEAAGTATVPLPGAGLLLAGGLAGLGVASRRRRRRLS